MTTILLTFFKQNFQSVLTTTFEVSFSIFSMCLIKVQKNTVKKIHILKDSRGLGVQISMKLNHVTGEKGVFVSDISPGGAAAR